MQKKEDAIHRWYDDHAHEFAEADVIELPFVGKSREFQERLNRFKLWAVDHGGIVDLSGKHVLEFGAGHGRLALTYPDMASYTGVDYSKNLVEIGNRRLERAGLTGRARLMRGDALTFDDQRQYDIVCSLGMMCYFADPVPVVTAMSRLVKPGGSVLLRFSKWFLGLFGASSHQVVGESADRRHNLCRAAAGARRNTRPSGFLGHSLRPARVSVIGRALREFGRPVAACAA